MRWAITVVVALSLLGAGTAHATELQTWEVPSAKGNVDPAKAGFSAPPPGETRKGGLRVNVLLPDGYDGKTAFPVLWLLHGHDDAYDTWINSAKGDLRNVAPGFPGIIVMPEAGAGWYTDWWAGGARGTEGHGWERYLLDEVMPYVESRLNIAAGRANHAIAGLSMGGEGAAYLAEQRPGYFGAIATFSGCVSILRPEWPVGYNTQGQDYQTVYGPSGGFYAVGHDPTSLAPNLSRSRVFVSVGTGQPKPEEVANYFGVVAEADLHQHAEDFVAALNAAGAPVQYEPAQGIHDWPYWRAALASAITWGFFRPISDHPASWTYKTVRREGDAWDVHFRFDAPPEALITLTRDGNTLAATGSGTATFTVVGRPAFTATLPFSREIPPPA